MSIDSGSSTFWSGLTLRTKSLVVLSIPLVPLFASTVMILILARQEREAQRWVEHTINLKSIIARTERLAEQSDALLRESWLSETPLDVAAFDELAAQWSPAFKELSDATTDSPVQFAHTRTIAATRADLALVALRDYRVAHPESLSPPANLLTESNRVLGEIGRELTAMQQHENRLLSERIAEARDAGSSLQQVVLLGAALGMVGGVVGAISFSRTVSRRLDAVREDSVRLLRGERPAIAPPSQDELGLLASQMEQMWRQTTSRISELDFARHQLDQFFSVSLDMLSIADLDGRFTRLNPAWETVLGWTTEELLARPYFDLIHPDDLLATRKEVARQAVAATVTTIENRYRCKDGSYRWLSLKSVSRPEVGLVFAAARDVTEQRRINNELRVRVRDLKELNEELESFSYSVSHDLRAPLRHITGFISFVEKSAGGRLNEQERRWLTQSQMAGQRMGRLIDDLLSFSKMGRVPLARVHVRLNDVVREAIAEVADALPEGTPAITWRVDPLPAVRGDATLLRQAFVNLIGNAVKYSRTRQNPCIEIGFGGGADTNGETVVFVRDNGVGFDMQYVHKLFGVFQRLHDSDEFDGTGIGLASVRRIVSKHGGHVWAEGVVDRGATFYVSLPAIDGGPVS